MSCLVLALAGCGEADTADGTPTSAPAATETQAPTAAPTRDAEPTTEATATPATEPEATVTPTSTPAAATAEPTATAAPTNTPEPTATVAPTVAPEPATTTTPTNTPGPTEALPVPVVTGSNVEIESVEVKDSHTILVTLNGQLATVDPSDISFEKSNFDWTTYKSATAELTVTNSYSTTNAEGKTVLVYEVADYLRSTSSVANKTASNFSNLQSAITKADNYISWQMDNGGWDKEIDGSTAWTEGKKKNAGSGWTGKNGELIGTIDNEATYTQIRHIAAVYREVPDAKYQESVLAGLDFLFDLQYESGGFAQVYPRRGNYSDNVTFNDNAMINVLYLLEDALYGRYPFDSDIIPEDYKAKLEDSLDRAIDYILKSQIVSEGRLTAWCAQHDPVTYEPVSARAYELVSISGSESVPIVQFLMNQEQTPEIKAAVEAAIQWFKDSEVKDTEYVRKDSNGVYFVAKSGSRTWYRFYEIDTNLPIFCDRDGIMKHDILEIGEERRHGYAWAGTWPKKLLDAYDKYGYVTGSITVTVVGTDSATADGKTLKMNETYTLGK